MCLQILYIQHICVNTIWYLITYNDWYAMKPNQSCGDQYLLLDTPAYAAEIFWADVFARSSRPSA